MNYVALQLYCYMCYVLHAHLSLPCIHTYSYSITLPVFQWTMFHFSKMLWLSPSLGSLHREFSTYNIDSYLPPLGFYFVFGNQLNITSFGFSVMCSHSSLNFSLSKTLQNFSIASYLICIVLTLLILSSMRAVWGLSCLITISISYLLLHYLWKCQLEI